VDSSFQEAPVVLIFIVRDHSSVMRVVGMVLDQRDFLRNILARKLSEAAGDEFILAVVNKKTNEIVQSSSEVHPADLKQEKALWLFPHLFLGIRLKGKTIDELVESRSYRNIAIIVALDMMLLTGAWLIYRTIRREMELIQLKSDFVSNVSHELRTPLSLIRMFAETLEMKRVKTEKKKYEYYRTIVQESERLSRLVNNLLNFSRMEAGKRNYSLQTVSLNTVVSKVFGFYSLQLRSKNFEVVVDLEKNLPAVEADEEAIAEALHNVIDNAVKYSEKEKYLRVATGRKADMAYVEVQDRGIGIAPEHHGKIFEKFYRVSTGLVQTTKGSGLGLALVQHIVCAHGGRVEVHSTLGNGSTFRLLLPIHLT
jgi:two-component system phosphate regulon sensor histidine kinase PhoR